MNTVFSRPLSRAALAAALALALPALAPTTAEAAPRAGGAYSATLAAPLEQPRAEIVDGVMWRCTQDRCTGARQASRPVRTCARIARRFGPVARFAAPEGDLSTEDLARCNAQG